MRQQVTSGPEQVRRMDNAHPDGDPRSAPVRPREAWDAAMEHATPAELVRIGYEAATEHGEFDVAQTAWRRSAEHGEVLAMFNLAVLLQTRGEHAEAEQWYRRAAERDDSGAMADLSVLLETGGEDTAGEQSDRQVTERRDDAAMATLAVARDDRGKGMDARGDEPRHPDAPVDPGKRAPSHEAVQPREATHADGQANCSRPISFAVGVLAAALLSAGVLSAAVVPDRGTNGSAPAASAAMVARTTAARTVPPCRDNESEFTHTVRTFVDRDGDELGGINDTALVALGHAALQRPGVLDATRLYPFQRLRFLDAATKSLCL